ncbi:MAG: hypothetical protein ACQKBW_07225 [Puniceicoccales bacterium]
MNQLEAHFERVRQSFPDSLSPLVEALVLGGGYGRGEGGVGGTDEEPCLFNDLDYFLFTDAHNDARIYEWIQEVEREESAKLGIDVEITCVAPGDRHSVSTSMMFHDLAVGHYVVIGPEDYFAKFMQGVDAAQIVPDEAIRLLWNRGTGLFYARERLSCGQDAAFVQRNHMKASLALGDAILCFNGHHNAFCQKRRELLPQEEDSLIDEEILSLHAEGVAFKLRPILEDKSPAEMEQDNTRLRQLWMRVYLELESRRLGVTFTTPGQYASYHAKLYPGASTLRTLLLALRDRLKRGGFLRPINDYPRGALMRALVLLNEESPDWQRISHHLPQSVGTLSRARETYEPWWVHYS